MTPDRRRAITAVVWKDLRVAMASKSVVLPLAIVPLIFIVVLPVALALLAPSAATDAGRDLIRQLEDFSPTLLGSLEGLDDPQKVVVVGQMMTMPGGPVTVMPPPARPAQGTQQAPAATRPASPVAGH